MIQSDTFLRLRLYENIYFLPASYIASGCTLTVHTCGRTWRPRASPPSVLQRGGCTTSATTATHFRVERINLAQLVTALKPLSVVRCRRRRTWGRTQGRREGVIAHGHGSQKVTLNSGQTRVENQAGHAGDDESADPAAAAHAEVHILE